MATVLLAAGPPKGAYGRSSSLKWPHLYDILRSKGYDKSKAAAISNSRVGMRKKGRKNVLTAKQAHNPQVLKRLAAAQKKGKHLTGKQLTRRIKISASLESSYDFACHSSACRPPTSGGTGGSTKGGGDKAFRPITADQARGDSRPVSQEEFQRLANIGRRQLEEYADKAKKINLTDDEWSAVKESAYAEATQSWGGATIDLHTGRALPQGTNAYAITVKSLALAERTSDKKAKATVSIPENASKEEFNAAMELARKRFGYTLARENHYLGVFHDDDNKRIDFDPVLVVTKSRDVETIGAATHAIGGAYNFKDGLGYWPPHVDTSPTATRKRDDYQRTYEV